MLVRKTSTLGLLWLVWLGQSLPSWAAAGPLKVEMHVDEATVWPLEPVTAVIVVSNAHRSEVSHTGVWSFLVQVGYPGPAGMTWRYYSPCRHPDQPYPRPLPPTEKKFRPGESVIYFAAVGLESRNRHIFANPGEVHLKGQVAGLQAEPVVISVKEAPKSDREAWGRCRALPYPCLSPYSGYGLTADEAAKWEKFMSEFPGTRYESLARLGLASAYVGGIKGRKKAERAVELLEPLLTSTDDKMRQWAAYVAAFAYQGSGNRGGANGMASRLRRTATNRFFQCLADNLTINLARLWDIERGKTARARDSRAEVELSASDKQAMLKTVEAFRRAVESSDIDECLSLLHPEFKYRDAVDLDGWRRELEETIDEARGRRITFTQRNHHARRLRDGTPKVTVEEGIVVGDNEPQLWFSTYLLRQDDGKWRISAYLPARVSRARARMSLTDLAHLVNRLHRDGPPNTVWKDIAGRVGFASPDDVAAREWHQLAWGQGTPPQSSVSYDAETELPIISGRLTLSGTQGGKTATSVVAVGLKTELAQDGKLVVSGYAAEEVAPLGSASFPGAEDVGNSRLHPTVQNGAASARGHDMQDDAETSPVLVTGLVVGALGLVALVVVIGSRLRRGRAGHEGG